MDLQSRNDILNPIPEERLSTLVAQISQRHAEVLNDLVSPVDLVIGIQKDDADRYRVFLTFPPLLDKAQQTDRFIRHKGEVAPDEVLGWVDDHVLTYLLQQRCDHDFMPARDENGRIYPDGRGQCRHCGLPGKDVCETRSEPLIIMYREADIVAAHPWPDGTRMQGGKQGIVISSTPGKPGYTTAFVEAFFDDPQGVGAFVRGEGETVALAEDAAWEKASAILSCKQHDWTREVNGRHRTDGYAQCRICHTSSRVLEPETRCVHCDAPTSNLLGDDYVCLADKFSLSADEFIARSGKVTGLFGETINENVDDEKIKFQLRKMLFWHLGEEKYSAQLTVNSRLIVDITCQMLERLHGNEFAAFTEGDADHPFVIAALKQTEAALPTLFPHKSAPPDTQE